MKIDSNRVELLYVGKVVVGVLPDATEDQRVGSEVKDGCVG